MRAGLVSGVLGLGLLLSACGSDDNTKPVTEADLIGKWFTRKVVTSGTIKTKFPKINIDTTQKIDSTEIFTGTEFFADFKAGNLYESNQPDPPIDTVNLAKLALSRREFEKGKWWVSGNTLKTLPDGETDTLKSTVKIEGGNLKVVVILDSTFIESGATITFKLRSDVTASKN